MYLESAAIWRTMFALMERGIPSLSVHDSLIVQRNHATSATDLLCSNYEIATGALPVVQTKQGGSG